MTDYLAEGIIQHADTEFQIHLKNSRVVYFTLGLTPRYGNLRVRTQSGEVVGFINIEKVARTGLPGDYLLLGRRIWRVVDLTREEVIVEETKEQYYSKNAFDSRFREGNLKI